MCEVWLGMNSLECRLERDQSHQEKFDQQDERDGERERRLPLGRLRFPLASRFEQTQSHNCKAGVRSMHKPALTKNHV